MANFFNNPRDDDGEAPYSQLRQDLELTVAHIMSSLLQNSGLFVCFF